MTPERQSDALENSPWTEHLASPTDRRRLLRLAAGVGLTAAASQLLLGNARVATARQQGTPDIPAPGHTWLLDAPDALRPDAPGAPAPAEIDEVIDFQSRRSDETTALVNQWGGRQAVLPWSDFATQVIIDADLPALLEFRAQAILRTAMHDAVVAALDAQAAHARPAPAATDDRITPIGDDAEPPPSFPSVHAAVAGATTAVLAYLFPDASDDGFAGVADEAATSRIWAGAAFRSDIEAGLEIGRAVGDLAVAHGEADGSDAVWDGTGWPAGDGYYERTPPMMADPFAPLAGTWGTWVLPSGDAIRPGPFHEYGSLGWNAEIDAVRRATERRTPAEERIIDFWLNAGPSGYYSGYAQDLIERENLGEAEAASVLAMVSVAQYDSLVAVWDAKYTYWIARPITVDPDLDLYIPTPPYPSYPGGFGSASCAGATVLADLFPEHAVHLLSSAVEAAAQRGWSGIHYVIDDDVALAMGGQVGRMTVSKVRDAAGG
jgi:membrane-associated phospholipid phosphatase